MGPAAEEALLALLGDGTNPGWARGQAADLLGYAGSAEAVDSMLHILQDRSQEVALRCDMALYVGQTGDQRAFEPLAGIALNENEPEGLRAAAVHALGEAGGRRALPLPTSIVGENNPALREAAEIALEMLKFDPRYLEPADDPSTPFVSSVEPLLPPEGGVLTEKGEFEADAFAVKSIVGLRSDLSLEEIAAHYESQLAENGWARRSDRRTDAKIVSQWTFTTEWGTDGAAEFQVEKQGRGDGSYRLLLGVLWGPAPHFTADSVLDPLDGQPAKEGHTLSGTSNKE